MIETTLAFTNATISEDASSLQDIHLKNKNIVVYQRDITPIKVELDQVVEQAIECRASGTVEEIRDTLNTYFTNELHEHKALLKDIVNLLGLFEKTTKTSAFRLLLATVSTNMCRKFHTDINDLRMLCTYVGPGTLWIPDEAINQKAFHPSSKQDIVKDQSLIQQVDTGDVVILKGALYPEANAILHRSPTIETTGEKRLLLRIDTNATLNLWT